MTRTPVRPRAPAGGLAAPAHARDTHGPTVPASLLPVLLLAALLLAGCDAGGSNDAVPASRVTPERIEAARQLDVRRAGTARLTWIVPRAGSSERTRVAYRLSAPATDVEDVDIRGLLDGPGRYRFNQGRSYHMRVGRRYHGSNVAAHELKRALLRFDLGPVPDVGEVVDAELSLWVERFLTDSPLARDSSALPLHLYLYPIDPDWTEGEGGENRDDFSAAAPGEPDWLEARADERAWPAPGALAPDPDGPSAYTASPVAAAAIDGDDRRLTIGGPRLARHVRSARAADGAVAVLAKLADDEEDRWGTELAFLTSQYGVADDHPSRRPALSLVVEVPGPSETVEVPFVMEPDDAVPLPPSPFGDGEAILVLSFPDDDDGIPPRLRILRVDGSTETVAPGLPARVGPGDRAMLVAGARRAVLGEPLELGLEASWVVPGPRSEQRPAFVLIAPSGVVRELAADSVDARRYALSFTPDELGLWRYAWGFRPAPEWPEDAHGGAGLLLVEAPRGDGEAAALGAFADRVLALPDPADDAARREGVTRASNFVRWNRRFGAGGPEARVVADSLLASFRVERPAGTRK